MQIRNPVVYDASKGSLSPLVADGACRLTLHLVAEWDNVNCLTRVFPAQLIGVESNVTIAVA